MQPPIVSRAEGSEPHDAAADRQDRTLWRRRMAVTLALVVVWFAVTFGVTYYARELSVVLWGWPVSFWVAAQGALLVYVALVLVYARRMGRIDDERDARHDA